MANRFGVQFLRSEIDLAYLQTVFISPVTVYQTIKIKSFLVVDIFFYSLYFQYAIKLATKLNEKRLSSITELTTLEDKPITILDTGQRDKDRDKDNRDRERDWTYQKQNHIANNHHQQSVVNHSTNVSVAFLSWTFICLFCTDFSMNPVREGVLIGLIFYAYAYYRLIVLSSAAKKSIPVKHTLL